ncbi:nose resistant to fluoxetine protein 6-like [Pieris rapae]|uniref:nose resistant to fluoxetine protein 6-like n=1 Tax=Pieris rapae TaxID=64459 RepID=UPI001E281693|nr:nose resistant to fluoxetine protein 6-like [Pieris rapae]
MSFQLLADPRKSFDQELYKRVLNYTECERQLKYLSNSSLALPFIDASGKIPSGILSTNINDYGDYYECLDINKVRHDIHLEGKYCFIRIPLMQTVTMPTWYTVSKMARSFSGPSAIDGLVKVEKLAKSFKDAPEMQSFMDSSQTTNRMSLKLAVCIPKVCTVNQVADFITPPIQLPQVEFQETICRLPGDKMFSTADYIAFGVLGTVILLTILSTCYDLFQVFIRKKSRSNRLLSCMSVYTNTIKLLTFKSPKYAMHCVDGIRAISMLWVIVGHAYVFELLSPAHNLMDMREWTTYFKSTWINAAPLVVDTFFMLSGLFCVYILPKSLTPLRFTKTLHIFYLYRYLRTLPILAIAVLLQASFFFWINDGPDWDRIAYGTEACRSKWWATLLHVQNYLSPVGVCVFQSWYLTVDMQLYFLSPVIIFFLLWSESVAWFALAFSFLMSIVVMAYYCFTYEFPSIINSLWYTNKFYDYYKTFYVNTATRASPFIVGLIFGYILWKHRGKRIIFTMQRIIAYWTVAFIAMAYCIFMIYPFAQLPYEFSFHNNLYNSIMRAIWAASVGWIILACTHGYGGPLNWFLSLPMWRLPSRLSYAVYLTHVQVIMTNTNSVLATRYFTEIDTLYFAAGYTLLSLALGFVICLLIDEPCATLLKLAMVRKRPRFDKNTNTAEEENNEHRTKL